MFSGTLSLNSNKLNSKYCTSSALQLDSNQCTFPMTERVLNLVTYIQWEKPQVIEYDKICIGLKALSEILSIYSYIINIFRFLFALKQELLALIRTAISWPRVLKCAEYILS